MNSLQIAAVVLIECGVLTVPVLGYSAELVT